MVVGGLQCGCPSRTANMPPAVMPPVVQTLLQPVLRKPAAMPLMVR